MRKLIIIYVLLLSTTEIWSQKIQLGATIGSNYTFFEDWIPISNDNGSIIGFNGGVIGQIHLMKSFYLFSEINYEYGSYRTSHYVYKGTETDETISTVSITLPIKYYLGKQKHFYFYFGPYYSFIINMKRKMLFRNTGDTQIIDQTDLFQRSELGLLAGLGYNIKLKEKLNLFIESNYCESLFYFGESEYELRKHRVVRVKIGLFYTIE